MGISIIGHFGGNRAYYDGQTVKTITLYSALKDRCTKETRLHKVDTYYLGKNPIVFLGQFLLCIMQDKKIIVLLSNRGRKVLFPILFFLRKVLKKDIYHDSIGGQLAEEVAGDKHMRKYVSSFNANWVESKEIADKLMKMGVANALYVPNFKKLRVISEREIKHDFKKPFKFVTFSRVMREKGIEDAINAIKQINEEANCIVAELDIYGPIEKGYEVDFEKCINRARDVCNYCGVIPADESVNILKNYYALLFPTFWKGEGMPGSVIDAYSAGVPIIARRWQFSDELIQHGVTGYVYDFDKPEELVNLIRYTIANVEDVIALKVNCLRKAQEYSEHVVINIILEQMEI